MEVPKFPEFVCPLEIAVTAICNNDKDLFFTTLPKIKFNDVGGSKEILELVKKVLDYGNVEAICKVFDLLPSDMQVGTIFVRPYFKDLSYKDFQKIVTKIGSVNKFYKNELESQCNTILPEITGQVPIHSPTAISLAIDYNLPFDTKLISNASEWLQLKYYLKVSNFQKIEELLPKFSNSGKLGGIKIKPSDFQTVRKYLSPDDMGMILKDARHDSKIFQYIMEILDVNTIPSATIDYILDAKSFHDYQGFQIIWSKLQDDFKSEYAENAVRHYKRNQADRKLGHTRAVFRYYPAVLQLIKC